MYFFRECQEVFKPASKFNEHQYKVIVEVYTVSTPEYITNNSPIEVAASVISNKPSAIKSLCHFSDPFYVKQKTSFHKLDDDKTKRKAIRKGNSLCSTIQNLEMCNKNYVRVKKDMHHWIIQHLQVVRSTIANYIVKLYIDGHTEKSISKLLL